MNLSLFRVPFGLRLTSLGRERMSSTTLRIFTPINTLLLKNVFCSYLPNNAIKVTLQIESVKIHHLSPGLNKIIHKFFLRIGASIDFGQCP